MKKYSLIIIIVSALLLEGMGAAQYFLGSKVVEEEVLAKAKAEMNQDREVAVVKAEVESAIRNSSVLVEKNLSTPDNLYEIITKLVLANPHIAGAGVAFRPNYYKDSGHEGLFAPRCYDMEPDISMKNKTAKKKVKRDVLPFNYVKQDWFIRPYQDDENYWSPPYTHKIDAGPIVLCTYSVPVRNWSGETVGVLFADIPMENVSRASLNFQQGVVKNRTILFIIQVVSLLVIFVIVMMSVRAFRRYKEQVVDPEKEDMAKEIEKLRAMNLRLTERYQKLAREVNKSKQ